VTSDEILVFPRRLAPRRPFSLWHQSNEFLVAVKHSCRWLDRAVAEASREFVQVIPVAVVTNFAGDFLLLRRIQTARRDLRSKYSLVISGHLDRQSATRDDLLQWIDQTLVTELEEEIGLRYFQASARVGIIVDHKSVEASRHVGFVSQVVASEPVRSVRASEEFTSVLHNGERYVGVEKIADVRTQLDPWSRILFDSYFHPGDR